ncbi:uncharacterized protein LOC131686081 [Topomyia yanbarensis]|uniref:uncharacterized protein LOC131686081 n=1 Tax=Topomyia yanbarensis TaxID=2498891 RepID=UPI00273B6492|nr:uncharacterized protein LOC131686081 [Topomyia yanbarensis]
MYRIVVFITTIFLTHHSTNLQTLGAFITKDQCKQSDVLPRQTLSISVDCSCPPNFTAVSVDGIRICLILTMPQIWSNTCVSFGCTKDFYSTSEKERKVVKEFLRKENVSEFWISVQKDEAFSLPLRKLPGPDWGTPLNLATKEYDLKVKQTSDGNCLKANITDSSVSFDNCAKLLPQLCIYHGSTLLQLYCSKSEYTTRYSDYQNYCFKIVKSEAIFTGWELYNVDGYRKLQVHRELVRKHKISCDKTVVQSNLTNQLGALFAVKHSYSSYLYVAIQEDGTMGLYEKFDCVAYEHERKTFHNPELILNFDRLHLKLMLVIYYTKYLWRDQDTDIGFVCYTDADADLLKQVTARKIWPPDSDDEYADQTMYELKLYGDFPGNYWCEGHAVPNFTLVRSNTVVAQKKENNFHIYSILLDVHSFDLDRIQQKSYLKQLAKTYKNYLDIKSSHETASLIKGMQIMKIENLDTINKTLSLIMHVAATFSGLDLSYDTSGNATFEGKLRNLKEKLHHLFKNANNDIYCYKRISSSEFCLPEYEHVGLSWPLARIGQTVASLNLCLIESTGLPLTRKCMGDRLFGGNWQELDIMFQCAWSVGAITKNLFDYHVKPTNFIAVQDVFSNIVNMIQVATSLIPADIFYLSKTIENIRPTLFNDSNNAVVIGNQKESFYCSLTAILNKVMSVNESIVLRSQVALNATSILLDSAEAIINQMSQINSSLDISLNGNVNCLPNGYQHLNNDHVTMFKGSILLKTSKLILLIAVPSIDNIAGIALLKPQGINVEKYTSFDMWQERLIYADENEEEIMKEEGLEIAGYVPGGLLENIKLLNKQMNVTSTVNSELRIVISIYFNDNLFKETDNGTILRSNSKIISITVPGCGSDLPGDLPIFFRDANSSWNGSCGYWDFKQNEVNNMPKWSFRGCKLAQQNGSLSLCKCSHFTPFSRLITDIQYIESLGVSQHFIGDQANVVLDIITSIGCCLSLLGVGGIFMTALVFPMWRTKANSKILLQLSMAIAIEMIIVFLDGPDIDHDKQSSKIHCTLLGGAFHYIILVTFMWMLVIAYLQFLRYVKILGRLRPSHCILKASFMSWGLPLLPVVVFSTYDYTNYHKRNNVSDICYPHGPALYLGLLLPISVIIIANVSCFLLILYNVFYAPDNLQRSTDKHSTFSQLRLSSFLFFLLGLPWIFGMIITFRAGPIFSYLFCLTAPLQGFVLFIYFIIMDPTARKLWGLKLLEYRCSKSSTHNLNMSMK